MKREVMWATWSKPGLEHLLLTNRGDEIAADGIILGVENGVAFRLHYEVRCDAQWRVRQINVHWLDKAQRISLTANGEGSWSNERSENTMPAKSPEEICQLFQPAMAAGDLDAVLNLYDPSAVFVKQSGEAKYKKGRE